MTTKNSASVAARRRMQVVWLLSFSIFPLGGCGPPVEVFDASPLAALGTSAPARITANADHEEDPMVVAARDGTFRVVWWAKRNGQVDLFMRSSQDGRVWSDERQITNDADEDFYPWLSQTRDGAFHLVWFRMVGLTGLKTIWYARSSGGQVWTRPRQISTRGSNWVPSAYEDSNNVLWVIWSSEESRSRRLVTVSSADGGLTWSTPHRLTNGPGEDDFPQIIQSSSGERTLAWTRYRTGSPQGDYISDPSAQLLVSRSHNGVDWSTPVVESPPDPKVQYIDFLPSLFLDRDHRRTFLAWTSNRPGRRGDILVRDLSTPAAPIRQLTDSSASDYGARVVPTTQAGEYLMVWISTAEGGTHVFSRRIKL